MTDVSRIADVLVYDHTVVQFADVLSSDTMNVRTVELTNSPTVHGMNIFSANESDGGPVLVVDVGHDKSSGRCATSKASMRKSSTAIIGASCLEWVYLGEAPS